MMGIGPMELIILAVLGLGCIGVVIALLLFVIFNTKRRKP